MVQLIGFMLPSQQFAGLTPQKSGKTKKERVEHKDQQRQYPVHPEHDQGNSRQHQRRTQHRCHQLPGKTADALHILYCFGSNTTGFEHLVLGEGNTFKMAQNAMTQKITDLFRDLGRVEGFFIIEEKC